VKDRFYFLDAVRAPAASGRVHRQCGGGFYLDEAPEDLGTRSTSRSEYGSARPFWPLEPVMVPGSNPSIGGGAIAHAQRATAAIPLSRNADFRTARAHFEPKWTVPGRMTAFTGEFALRASASPGANAVDGRTARQRTSGPWW
jgi:hypothetical protein